MNVFGQIGRFNVIDNAKLKDLLKCKINELKNKCVRVEIRDM